MKKTIKKIGSIIVIVFAVLFVLGIISYAIERDSNKQPYTLEKEEVKQVLSEFKVSDIDINSEMKEAFMDSCTNGNLSETKFCNCSYDYILRKVGTSGIMDMSVEILNDRMSTNTVDIMSDAVIYCY